MKHYIKDNQGNLLEVSDLQVAIYQVAAYLHHLYDGANIAHEDQIKYWKDVYTKLNHLKEIKEKDYARLLFSLRTL